MMLPLLSEIGRRRKVLDLTQQGLAKEAGVSRSLIAKVETGNANPSYGEAKKIFETLDRLEVGVQQGLAGMTLDKVHTTEIEYAEADEPLYEAEQRMIDKYYSQLPVMRNGQIVGSLTERGINRALMANKGIDPKDMLVEDAMEEGFPLVPASATVGSVASILQASQGILTVKAGKVVGIITNSDLLKLCLR
jgi:predicted transcriptional regulator